ncbi:hypothetical protein CYMTET_47665 [Cymbomonas tetramitiformis]|uniref:Uncharacterized protein n=1 Tax=Cymbomonas tetramitiformis TaxID=36881 RepID=A0AAE0BTT5_9CHLO|nr:hypothetical protein CYMTET_47665 [Cymbomonas tetramitiformis]|eukprot:gene9651-11435_t
MQPVRRTLFPIVNTRQFEFYKKALASFWTVEEVDLSDDVSHFEKLKREEQRFVRMILGFFASADSVVAENLAARFLREEGISMETACFYGYQITIENIHSEMYSLFIDSLIKDREEKNRTFEIAEQNETVREKTVWAIRYIDSEESLSARLLAFACVEGIFFSASFCAIFLLKKRGLMPGLAFSNELIARDEGMHRDFALLLLQERAEKNIKLSRRAAEQIVRSAVDIEKKFVRDSLSVDLIGMNAALMQSYVEFCADHLLANLYVTNDAGEAELFGTMYNTANPFDWMETISLNGKTNFFERRVSEYQKNGVMCSLQGQQHEILAEARVFSVCEDF